VQTSRRTIQAGLLTGALLVPLLVLTSGHALRAQSSTTTTRDGWLAGALVGRIRVASVPDAHATAIGLGVTRFAPRRPGLDLAVVTIPRLFRDGQIPLHARMGMALPLGSGNGPFLVPNVGVDAAGVAGETDGGWVGYHVGTHALFTRRELGFEAGVAWVRAVGAPNTLWLVELGLMRVPLLAPPRPRPTTPLPGES
jgi:hypothetical protein